LAPQDCRGGDSRVCTSKMVRGHGGLMRWKERLGQEVQEHLKDLGLQGPYLFGDDHVIHADQKTEKSGCSEGRESRDTNENVIWLLKPGRWKPRWCGWCYGHPRR
jgi:hypothetical protein